MSAGLTVLWRDDRFAVVDKPAGMPVHRSRNDGAISVEDLFPTLGRVRAGPFLAHRLDRDTSGCLVIALRRSALRDAQALFGAGRADKLYWALVRGSVPGGARSGRIRSRLARIERGGSWRMEPVENGASGRMADTEWRVGGEAADGSVTWLELRPRTGRTHQVRAHCRSLGCPVLGDAVYGGGDGKLALHARSIDLPLDPPVRAVAPPPAHMRGRLLACGMSAAVDSLR